MGIGRCEEIANITGKFAQELYVSSGGSNSSKDKHYSEIPNKTKQQIYYRLDMPFRKWLRSIDPKCSSQQKADIISQWQKTAKGIALEYADELVESQPETAVIGHKADGKIYSSSKAKNIYIGKINKIYRED